MRITTIGCLVCCWCLSHIRVGLSVVMAFAMVGRSLEQLGSPAIRHHRGPRHALYGHGLAQNPQQLFHRQLLPASESLVCLCCCLYVASVQVRGCMRIWLWDGCNGCLMVVWASQEDVDNDDGSRYYHTHDNFFVYGNRGLKTDFGA